MAFNSSVTPEDVCDLLNELLGLDSEATFYLIENRVKCNNKVVSHPFIQVHEADLGGDYKVGMLGVVNGLFGTGPDGFGAIVAEYDCAGYLSGFKTSGSYGSSKVIAEPIKKIPGIKIPHSCGECYVVSELCDCGNPRGSKLCQELLKSL